LRKSILSLIFLLVLASFIPLSFAQGVQTAGGVNVDGSWYVGEGLKQGDYFEYSFCELDLNECAPIKLKMWIKGEISHKTEALWDTRVVIYDGNKIIKGSMGLGKISSEPITVDNELFDYAMAFKSSIVWLSGCASGFEDNRILGPKEFREVAWCRIAAIGGAQLIPIRAETITIPAGTVDAVVVGWSSGSKNEIWIVDDFPFPVKALTFAWVTTGRSPIMHEYTLLDYKENESLDEFEKIIPTPPDPKKIGCPTNFYEYESGRISTNTFSMMIQYNYSPKYPMEGCDIDWKINFMNKYNDVEFEDEVHYDIWVVDEDGIKLRSYAKDLGRVELFNAFGQVHRLLPVEEEAGIVRYAIFVYGTGPKYQEPDASMSGYAVIEIEIEENPLQKNVLDNSSAIPEWIKSNAGWWADGAIDDDSFVLGIEYLIKNQIMKIPKILVNESSTGVIPSWIKSNAGWWADGSIDDDSFVLGIEYLIKEGVLKI